MKRTAAFCTIAVTIVLLGTLHPRRVRAQTAALDRAVLLFQESERLYDAGRYDEATSLLERAYELHPEPTLLFNLGRSREGAGDRSGAVEAYQRYLSETPDAPDRASIEVRIARLQQEIALRPPETDDAPLGESDASSHRSRGPELAPWILVGVGGGLLITAIGFGVGSTLDAHDAQAEPVQERAVELHSRAEAFALTANVLYVVGGLTLIAGGTWGVIDLIQISEESRVTLLPTGLAVRGRF